MLSSEMLRGAPLVRTDVSEKCIAFIIKVTRIDELRIMLAATSNRGTQLAQEVSSQGLCSYALANLTDACTLSGL
jgi:hypothetical protein